MLRAEYEARQLGVNGEMIISHPAPPPPPRPRPSIPPPNWEEEAAERAAAEREAREQAAAEQHREILAALEAEGSLEELPETLPKRRGWKRQENR
jgi:hypothetical protein